MSIANPDLRPSTLFRRSRPSAVGLLVASATLAALPAALVRPAAAQPVTQADLADAPVFMVVTARETKVLSGASESYYHFRTLRDGAVVKVVSWQPKFLGVRTEGAAFADAYGWVRHRADRGPAFDRADRAPLVAGRFDPPLEVVTATPVDVRAANKFVTEDEAAKSWRMIVNVPAGRTLLLHEAIDNGEGRWDYRVDLPADAMGWIKAEDLARATPEQARRFAALPAPGADAEGGARTVATNEPAMTPVRPPAGDAARTVEMGGATTVTTPPRRDDAVTDGEPKDPEPASETAVPVFEDPPAAPARPLTEAERLAPLEPAERLDRLESLYAELRQQPIEDAEVGPLRALYLSLGSDGEATAAIRGYAVRRAEQLEIWGRLQERRLALASVRSRLELTETEAAAIDRAMQATVPYAAVGRLAASTIYDGERLPRLYRVIEARSGRTLAYVRGGAGLESAVGGLVGITGEASFDPGLQLDVVTPERIDRLDRAPATP